MAEEYPIEDLLLAEPDDPAAAPCGDRYRPFVRVLVNGRFNQHFDGLDMELGMANGSR